MEQDVLVSDLAVVLMVAGVTSVIAKMLKQSTVLGFLIAGVLVGPHLNVPVFADLERVEAMAELGVVLVMFAVGLEFRLGKLFRVLPVSGLTGLVQVSFMTWCGFSLGQSLGWDSVGSVFLGASIGISSTMVVSKVLEQRPIEAGAKEQVFGILVIQDVVAILLLAAMTGVAAGEELRAGALWLMLLKLAFVLIAMLGGGLLLVPRFVRFIARFESAEILIVASVGLCFGMAILAEHLGYSVALGAFVCGMLVAESGRASKVEHLVQPLRDVFAAIFFVSIGMTVDLFRVWSNLPTALLVFATVVLGQLLVVTFAGVLSGNGLRRSIVTGCALGQIGEFAFIIANIGIEAEVVPSNLRAILVTTAVLTAFSTPLMIGMAGGMAERAIHKLPHRVHVVLNFYEAWLARFRDRDSVTPPEVAAEKSKAVAALKMVLLDTFGLNLLSLLIMAWYDALEHWLEAEWQLVGHQADTAVFAAYLVLALPLVIGLVMNSLRLARAVSLAMVPLVEDELPIVLLARKMLRAIVHLLVVMLVGFPLVTLIRPYFSGHHGALLLVLVIGAVLAYLWRNAGKMDQQMQSGVGEVIRLLGRQGEASMEMDAPPIRTTVIPGLNAVARLSMHAGGPWVGKSLAELDLRAQTGATIIAIGRGINDVVLPSATEVIREGDVLTLGGGEDGIAKARAVLVSDLDNKHD